MSLLPPFSLPGRFWRGNLHTHSNLSDGALPLEGVINAYKKVGYDFLQMSEHFVSHFKFPIADTRAFRGNDFTTLIGVELHAPETSAGELWHIVAAGLPLDFPPPGPNETGPQLAARARAAGAFIAIAHPAWSRYTIEDGRAIESAHAVEIYNHGCEVENDLGDGWYLHDQLLNEGRRLTAIATDDAHFTNPDYFGGWVNVKAESLAPDALLAALKAGAFYASQGPEIHSVELRGKELTVHCSPVDFITVVCGNSRTCGRHGKSITSATFDLTKLEKGWLLKKPSDWFRVTAIDHAGKKAWTNAYWWDELQG
ncbi:MAG: CehA/McbA family metallohydrolase [Alphaproteobacteria bacterium]|nr:CehA/McbA family metallohydrolase [Alphaproteobacteria bacterium]